MRANTANIVVNMSSASANVRLHLMLYSRVFDLHVALIFRQINHLDLLFYILTPGISLRLPLFTIWSFCSSF